MITISDDDYEELKLVALKGQEIVKAVEHISHLLNAARRKNPLCIEIIEALGLHQGLSNEARKDIRKVQDLLGKIKAENNHVKNRAKSNEQGTGV